MPTRQATPGTSTGPVLHPSYTNTKSTKKRSMPDSESSTSLRDSKKLRTEVNKDKKRRRKRKRKTSIAAAAISSRPESQSKSRGTTTGAKTPVLSSSRETSPPTHLTLTEDASVADPVEEADPTPSICSVDKGKGKAKEDGEEPPSPSIEPYDSRIARLTQELKVQSLLLQRHQAHLTQIHQSLTCQICLDLLHKPFALAPCGHIACYDCLVRWFTGGGDAQANAGPHNGTHVYKRKICPVCRAVVVERPVQVWGVKSMVTNIVRSGLVELLAPAPALAGNETPDPWHNIFRPLNRRGQFHGFHPAPPINHNGDGGGGGLEAMGMYDAEDGGVYRCLDCMHEIWGGTCSNCQRVYLGHPTDDDDEDDDGHYDEDDESLDDELFIDHHGGGNALLADLLEMVAAGGAGWGDGGSDLDEDEEDGDGDGSNDWEVAYGEPQVFGDVGAEEGIAGIEEVEEEEYGGSFIDDGEGEEGYDDSFIDDEVSVRNGDRVEHIVISDDEEDDMRQAGRQFRVRAAIVIDSDEE